MVNEMVFTVKSDQNDWGFRGVNKTGNCQINLFGWWLSPRVISLDTDIRFNISVCHQNVIFVEHIPVLSIYSPVSVCPPPAHHNPVRDLGLYWIKWFFELFVLFIGCPDVNTGPEFDLSVGRHVAVGDQIVAHFRVCTESHWIVFAGMGVPIGKGCQLELDDSLLILVITSFLLKQNNRKNQ